MLFLIGPEGDIQDAKVFPEMGSKEQCVDYGKAAEDYYAQRGLLVKHKCLTEI